MKRFVRTDGGCRSSARRGRLGLRGSVVVAALAPVSDAQTPAKRCAITRSQWRSPRPRLNSSRRRARLRTGLRHRRTFAEKSGRSDPNNYAAWFDLGFLYNALGKTDDSIAAYRKSVAAKPDVFESNLNLGLMLVKAGQPGAAAVSARRHQAETYVPRCMKGMREPGCPLATCLRQRIPTGALEAYAQAAISIPKIPSRIFPPARCWKNRIGSPTPNRNTSRCWRSSHPRPTR